MRFEEYSLEDVLEIKYGKNQKKVKDDNGPYPILGTGGVMGHATDYLYDQPSVLIGRKGSISKVRYIDEPFWTVDTLFYTIVNETIVYPRFIYYYLSLIDFNYYNEGTTIPSLRTQTLNQIKLNLPSLKDQDKILQMINPIDDKIELNKSMISNLEEITQTLFKRWFVDFEFPNEGGKPYKSTGGKMVESELGMIPEGWKVDKFKKLYSIKSGYAFKSAWWTDSGKPVIKIKDLKNNTIIINELSYVDSSNVGLAKKFKVSAGDILIALTGATAGKFALIPKADTELYVNQRVGKIFYNNEEIPVDNSPYLLGLLLQRSFVERIIDLGSGSAQSNISPLNIEKMSIIIPTPKYMNEFNEKMKSIIKHITELYYENNKLQDIGDTLLPKLLSGEIELPDDLEVTDDVPIP